MQVFFVGLLPNNSKHRPVYITKPLSKSIKHVREKAGILVPMLFSLWYAVHCIFTTPV